MEPPLASILSGLDAYKISMGQLQWLQHRQVQARFELTNRSEDRYPLLPTLDLDRLREQVEDARRLRFTDAEIAWLAQAGFSEDYLAFLRTFALPELAIDAHGGNVRVVAEGRWCEVTFWETIALALVNELYSTGRARAAGLTEQDLDEVGRKRLHAKIDRLRTTGASSVIEFGTRRRRSEQWQAEVTETLLARLGDACAGTSNLHLARVLGLPPVGTYAHEMVMAYAAIHADLVTGTPVGQRAMMEDWFGIYGEARSIALTDTYGSAFFFRDFASMANRWRGLRQDSGDPFAFGETAIRFYRDLGIDPLGKVIVFSDGLTVDLVLALRDRFAGRVGLSFGWGTDLTNDCGVAPISLVMKLVEVDGVRTVKLSDNLAKAMGSPADIERAKTVYGNSLLDAQPLVY